MGLPGEPRKVADRRAWNISVGAVGRVNLPEAPDLGSLAEVTSPIPLPRTDRILLCVTEILEHPRVSWESLLFHESLGSQRIEPSVPHPSLGRRTIGNSQKDKKSPWRQELLKPNFLSLPFTPQSG